MKKAIPIICLFLACLLLLCSCQQAIKSAVIDENGDLIITMDDDSSTNLGKVKGADAEAPLAPQIRINPTTKEWEISNDGGVTFESTGVSAVADMLVYSLLDDGTYEVVTAISDKLTEIYIPSTHQGIAVTSIAESAFEDYSLLTTISIPESITKIGNNAFSGCGKLSTVYYNAREAEGSTNNFAGWKGDGITLFVGSEVVVLPELFSNHNPLGDDKYNKLTNVIFANNSQCTEIGAYAFVGSKLTSIAIPPSVTHIKAGAFLNCYSLESVYIEDLDAWENISFQYNDSNPFYYDYTMTKYLYLNGELYQTFTGSP